MPPSLEIVRWKSQRKHESQAGSRGLSQLLQSWTVRGLSELSSSLDMC
jgi:hypothetical protein